MNDMLKDILEMDKKAQEHTKELEEYRRKAIAELSAKKDEIVKEEQQKASESALRRSNRNKEKGEAELQSVKERNKKILDNMNKLNEEKKNSWIDAIVADVIG